MALELYIEKEFLEDFYIKWNPNSSTNAQKIFISIIEDYYKEKVVINSINSTFEELENLKGTLPFFSKLLDDNLETVDEIYSHFTNNSKCNQTIIFAQNKYDWFLDAENKGALCFYIEDFENRIDKIIHDCNAIKIDLSEAYNCEYIEFETLQSIPKNKISLYDKYIIDNNNTLKDFLEKFLKKIALSNTKVDINVFSTNYLDIPNFNVQAVITRLNSIFANYLFKFSIQVPIYKGIFNHDRIIYSNFFIIECPSGFNQIGRPTNSKITVDSIFDLFTYKRMHNHSKKY